eukprot:IDg20495t1
MGRPPDLSVCPWSGDWNVVQNRVERSCRAVGRATIDVRDCKTHTTNKIDWGRGSAMAAPGG